MSKGNEPAFPLKTQPVGKAYVEVYSGLTKREWFAGMALQGMLANNFHSGNVDWSGPLASKQAFQFADAMIAESEKGK